MKRQTRRADEQDVVSRLARRVLVWRRGEVREIKRRLNRRERHTARQQLRGTED